jgi:hypothetical protein
VEPLAIFIILLVWMALAGIAVKVFRHVPSRPCPHCDAKVEIGRASCQDCGYRFTSARYWK